MQATDYLTKAWDCVITSRLVGQNESTAASMFEACTQLPASASTAIINAVWAILPRWKEEEEGGLQKKRPYRKGKKVPLELKIFHRE